MSSGIELRLLTDKARESQPGYITLKYELEIEPKVFQDYQDLGADSDYEPDYPLELLETTAVDLIDLNYRLQRDSNEEDLLRSHPLENSQLDPETNLAHKGQFAVDVSTNYLREISRERLQAELEEEINKLLEDNNSLTEMAEEHTLITENIERLGQDNFAHKTD